MKLLLITILVAAVSSGPIPDENNGPVDMIVNGVPDGEALEIGKIVKIKLNEHTDGEVVATDLLHPYSALGIAEANLAAGEPAVGLSGVVVAEVPKIPEPVHLPAPVAPVVEGSFDPESVHLPPPVAPVVEDHLAPEFIDLPPPVLPIVEVPEPVLLPEPVAPEVVPDPVYLPSPGKPEVVEEVPSPAAQDGDIYNDGVVSVSFNGPEDPGMLSTLASWFNMVMNYFNNEGSPASDQIV